jgi:hypothetical protein
MKNFVWSSVFAVACMLSACLGAEPTQDDADHESSAVESTQEELKINPCALVRCRAGTQCQVYGGRPLCVPVPLLPECTSDADCRLFSNYCDGCECLALSKSEPSPICEGNVVACFVDPCRASEARCEAGQCVVGGAASF